MKTQTLKPSERIKQISLKLMKSNPELLDWGYLIAAIIEYLDEQAEERAERKGK